jgi:hypothetical protein
MRQSRDRFRKAISEEIIDLPDRHEDLVPVTDFPHWTVRREGRRRGTRAERDDLP